MRLDFEQMKKESDWSLLPLAVMIATIVIGMLILMSIFPSQAKSSDKKEIHVYLHLADLMKEKK